MNSRKYTWILYSIVAVIAATIALQIYWNYKNYLSNKRQLINDVQLSLDNAIETYFADLASNETIAFAFESQSPDSLSSQNIDSLLHYFDIPEKIMKSFDSIKLDIDGHGGTLVQVTHGDTIYKTISNSNDNPSFSKIRSINSEFLTDSTAHHNFRTLTSRVIVALTNDSLSLKAVDTLFSEQLKSKSILIDYGLVFKDSSKEHFINKEMVDPKKLSAKSESPYLHHGNTITAYFSNPTKIILGRILSGILLSSLLVLAVIASLFYLLNIIKHQKQLAEVKNDLISNITHEFKTPIATIGVALESIKNFNVLNDVEKTSTYLDMSTNQLNKLTIMVEKLLETATLDSDNLELNKETINISELMEMSVKKHQLNSSDKHIQLNLPDNEVLALVDLFHFENAINNVIDNAIKYGGNKIIVQLSQNSFSFTVAVSDNGNSLTKENKDRIFEKFYRVNKGNTHDVKGFGIGLYYTKTIVEKHEGAIHLDLNNNRTSFTITLPK